MTSSDRRPLPHHRDQGFRLTLPDDWRALLRTRANVLLTGSEKALEAFLSAAESEFHEPIVSISSGQALSLDKPSTLILRDVHKLDYASQRRLMAWGNESKGADTQIVSLTPVALHPLVNAGSFDRDLFYWLNTIRLEVALPN
jgi:DNA-binding NtrC family response regulator